MLQLYTSMQSSIWLYENEVAFYVAIAHRTASLKTEKKDFSAALANWAL